MASFLPSIPYPPEQEGYWAPRTSTIDWCEENYYATVYSAEIVNTLTNLLFMWLAYQGMSNCRREGHDKIFYVTFTGYLLVGTGSFAFHATLKYPMQLVDELSMIYTTCLMFWATFAHNKSRFVQTVLGFVAFAIAAGITGYYHYLQDPAFHQNAYSLLTAIVLGRSMFLMEKALRPRWRGPAVPAVSAAEQQRRDERDLKILSSMWFLLGLGLGVSLAGFGIWTLDNEYCSQWRAWRYDLGLPWGILLEGHGWWHLMTGSGAYCAITWGIWLRHCLNGRHDEFELVWPSLLTSVPRIMRVKDGQTKKKT